MLRPSRHCGWKCRRHFDRKLTVTSLWLKGVTSLSLWLESVTSLWRHCDWKPTISSLWRHCDWTLTGSWMWRLLTGHITVMEAVTSLWRHCDWTLTVTSLWLEANYHFILTSLWREANASFSRHCDWKLTNTSFSRHGDWKITVIPLYRDERRTANEFLFSWQPSVSLSWVNAIIVWRAVCIHLDNSIYFRTSFSLPSSLSLSLPVCI